MKKTEDNSRNEEKLGRAVFSIAWILFAIKFLLIASLISLAVLWILDKPLWIAPIIAIIVFALYRMVWRLFWKFIVWSNK